MRSCRRVPFAAAFSYQDRPNALSDERAPDDLDRRIADAKAAAESGNGGSAKPAEKTLGNPQSAAAKDPDLAAEIAAWKPRPTARVKPVYPDEARSSEIEGTVIVEVVIDCTGKVSSARVAKGLGHGLDEAALTAIRKTEFEAAPRCAPGFQKSMKINYAFRLGD